VLQRQTRTDHSWPGPRGRAAFTGQGKAAEIPATNGAIDGQWSSSGRPGGWGDPPEPGRSDQTPFGALVHHVFAWLGLETAEQSLRRYWDRRQLSSRAYLTQVSNSARIRSYIEQCLTAGFPKSGMVLQELVNELGRRLDYVVTNGRYQGTPSKIGFDGIWRSPEGHTVIIEVKTTDAYRISLATVADYRTRLITEWFYNPELIGAHCRGARRYRRTANRRSVGLDTPGRFA
jgi:hypothetical protein